MISKENHILQTVNNIISIDGSNYPKAVAHCIEYYKQLTPEMESEMEIIFNDIKEMATAMTRAAYRVYLNNKLGIKPTKTIIKDYEYDFLNACDLLETYKGSAESGLSQAAYSNIRHLYDAINGASWHAVEKHNIEYEKEKHNHDHHYEYVMDCEKCEAEHYESTLELQYLHHDYANSR
jgi:hypothetical protein